MNKRTVATKMLNRRLSQREIKHARGVIRRNPGAPRHKMHKLILSEFPHRIEEDWQAERILRTEESRIGSMNFKKQAKRAGQKRFTVHSSSPCPICQKQIGQHNLSGNNLPPYHPNCRCQAH